LLIVAFVLTGGVLGTPPARECFFVTNLGLPLQCNPSQLAIPCSCQW
jgi:hypothetical protein